MSDHKTERLIQIWMPRDLAQRLDHHLASQVAHLPGAKPSRQGYLVDLVRRALSDAAASRVGPAPGPTDAA